MANFTDNWSPFGFDVYCRKLELYQMEWQKFKVDLSTFALTAAQSQGGNIAVVRDDRKKTTTANESQNSQISVALIRPTIVVFSSSGRVISQFVWNSGPLLQLGWSTADQLVCVQEDGQVLIYDMFGTFIRTFSMGKEASDVRVVDCRIFSNGPFTGVIVLTETRKFFVVSNIAVNSVVLRSMGELPGQGGSLQLNCWAVVCQERDVQVFFAKESDLYCIDKSGRVEQVRTNLDEPTKGFVSLAISPNQKNMALVTAEGIIAIKSPSVESDFISVFDSKSPNIPPRQLAWCGNYAVVGYWEKAGSHILLMIGPEKDWINYRYDSAVHLVSDMDSLRVICRDTHDVIQKVPSVMVQVMKVGSMAPGAYLLEACREYEALSYKADEYLKLVKPNLEDAVAQCIESAGQEFDVSLQKLLLRAASFGKAFMETENLSEKFVNMCKNLRVLNALRSYLVSMPMTWKQYESTSISALLDRLINRRQYELAYRICGYLDLPSQDGAARILLHWSSYKMNQRNESDEAIAKAIISKLEKTPGISFAECARNARALGRVRLAVELLERETAAHLQVPLLLEFGKDEMALSKAIISGNSDLVYDVILHLKQRLGAAEFLMRIRNNREVFALFVKYCRELNPKLLRDLFVQEDWHSEEAFTFIPESYEALSVTEQMAALQHAVERFDHAKDEFNKKITEDQIKLTRHQIKLEEKFPGRKFIGLTVRKTLENLIHDQNFKLADEFKKDYQISDPLFWFIKVDVLAQTMQWEELERFSKSSRRPVIGFEHFAIACFKNGNRTEAEKYLVRVDDDQKLRCLLRLDMLEDAAEFAAKQKDELALNTVLDKCRRVDNGALAVKIQGFKTNLGFT